MFLVYALGLFSSSSLSNSLLLAGSKVLKGPFKRDCPASHLRLLDGLDARMSRDDFANCFRVSKSLPRLGTARIWYRS